MSSNLELITGAIDGDDEADLVPIIITQSNVTDADEFNNPSPTENVPELARTLVTPVPAANEYVVIDSIVGEVSGDFSGFLVNQSANATLRSKVVGLDASPTNQANRVVSANELGCTNNLYTSGTRSGIGYRGALGQAVSVELYLHYSRSSGNIICSVLCLRNTVVNYRLVKPSRCIQ